MDQINGSGDYNDEIAGGHESVPSKSSSATALTSHRQTEYTIGQHCMANLKEIRTKIEQR